jgi:hypothetical protein
LKLRTWIQGFFLACAYKNASDVVYVSQKLAQYLHTSDEGNILGKKNKTVTFSMK